VGRPKTCAADREFRKEIEQKLRHVMLDRGLNQTQAAQQLNIKKQTISQYLRKKSTPSAEILARMCVAWDITLEYKGSAFGEGAFRATKPSETSGILQMDLFREPQVFENDRMVVTLVQSPEAALQVTIKLKQQSMKGG
jgi:transcriptional regulator with XRE-family HTH domain